MNKYKLGKKDEVTGLYRVIALRDIPSMGVRKGDIGGLIEKESNLSQSGDCWVYGDAWVYGNAEVYGDAWVYGNAEVYGDARVYGNAQVFGNARVFGDVWVYGNAEVYGNAWVYGNARVCGNAEVYGNARVCGSAEVYGDVRVCGSAEVYGDVRVYGDARVFGNARVYGYARVFEDSICATSPLATKLSMYPITVSDNRVHIGCQVLKFTDIRRTEFLRQLAKKNKYTARDMKQYLAVIKILIAEKKHQLRKLKGEKV